MAASPMALFPFIKTLVTVHLYRHFGAHQSTDGTSGTLAVAIECGRLVAGSVEILYDINGALGAEGDAKLASLTKFLVDLYVSFSHCYCHYILNRTYLTTSPLVKKTRKRNVYSTLTIKYVVRMGASKTP